jgi:putative copper resistance protein D
LLLGAHVHQRLSPSQATKGNPVASSPESIQRGMMLFSANCTQCHGESGTGDGPLAKTLPLPPANLYDHIPYHGDQFFFGVMTNGFNGIMPAFGSLLSENDRWDVLNYLRDRFGQPPPTQ